MGLLYTELCMACEEEFGIRIEFAEVGELRTVGDIYHYVLTVLQAEDRQRCHYPWAFSRFREAVVRYGKCRKSDVRPDAHVTALLPWLGRRWAWRKMGVASELALPSWREPFVFVTCIVVGIPLGIALGIGLGSLLERVLGETITDWVAPVLGALLVFAVPSLIAAMLWRITPACVPRWWTVDSVVRKAVKARYGIESPDGKHWDSASVWLSLKRVVSERLDISPELVTPDARLLEDLGAD